ncbi:MAG: hypothetical protein U5J63_18440 [Fodinibius sp.]|nr:hypothetical protein [Fodinibius sp.]
MLEAPEWINVVPITADNEVVLVEQYRYGIEAAHSGNSRWNGGSGDEHSGSRPSVSFSKRPAT